MRANCSAFDDVSFYHRVATCPQTCILYRSAPRSTALARVGHLGRSQSKDLVPWVTGLRDPEEEHVKHRLKTGDLCLITALLLALVGGGAWWLINYANGRNTSANGLVVVTQSKDGFRRVDELARDATFTVETNGAGSGRDADGGENVISISEGRVEVKSANCGNQVCVEHAPISQAGEQIVCLPHGLVVEVVAEESDAAALR